jgi:CheY-like chemotaxis protein/HPt (histidine-containing phosphotransfer) domain-containing protein
LRILLAEDNAVNQKVIGGMLAKRGHEVAYVGDGQSAVEAAGAGGVDLILMDVQMPGMDGLEAVAAIRLDARARGLPHLPVVALTAHAMNGDRERCLAAGCDGYASKPIQSEALFAAIDQVLGGPVGPGTGPKGPLVSLAVFDREEALEGMAGDEKLLGEVLRMFLDDCPRLLGKLRAAVAADDLAGFGRAVHTLRGTSGHVAAGEIDAAAERLDAAARSGSCSGASAEVEALAAAFDRFRRAVGDLAPGDASRPATRSLA